MQKNKKLAYIKLLILASIIIVLPVILYLTCKDTLFNTEWLNSLPQRLMAHPKTAALSLIGLQILQVIICFLPGQPIQFAASYLFGTLGGYLVSIVGAIIGAFAAYYIARFLGADAVKSIFGEEKVEKYRSKINSGKGLLIVLLIYLIPGLPKDLIGYVAGISSMRVIPFIIVSSIGRTPPMFGSLLVGTFFQAKNWVAIAILAVICAIILTICFIKRKALIGLLDSLEDKDRERRVKHGKERETEQD